MNLESIKLAIAASALGDDPREAPRLSHALGFSAIQFDAVSSALDIPGLSGSGRREFRQMLSSQDQQLVGLRADLGPKGFGPGADVDWILSRLDRVLESAAGLAAPLVCVDLGPLPEPPRESRPKPAISTLDLGVLILPSSARESTPAFAPPATPADLAFMSLVDSAMVELGRRADRYSVMTAFRTDLASFAALDRAVRQANCPWFGIDLDPAAAVRDEWSMDEIFSRVGPLVRHVRGRDAVKGAERRSRPAIIGAGSVEWAQLLADLDAAGYHGWLTIDPLELTDRIAAAGAGRKHLDFLRR